MPLTTEQLQEPVIIARGDLINLWQNHQTILDALKRISDAGFAAVKGPSVTGLGFTEVINLAVGTAAEKEIDLMIDCLKSNVATYHQILYGDNEGPTYEKEPHHH